MKNKITCIIVDDEKEAREGLRYMLNDVVDMEVLEICSSGIEAVDIINDLKPDLLLLDIQMPHISGFEVLRLIKYKPAVIFITAHDSYALKAFEIHAIDYLLKPFSDKRFHESLDRAREKINNKHIGENIEELVKDYFKSSSYETAVVNDPAKERLVVRADGNIYLLPLKSIQWIEAFDYYVKIHVEKRFHLVRDSMKNLLSKLPENSFFRIHRSIIVNLEHIDGIEQRPGAELSAILSNGTKLKVSRSYKADLIDKVNKIMT